MKIGDVVRLRPASPLRDMLAPWACASGRVADTYQDDGDDGLRISVAFDGPETGYAPPLSAEEFVFDNMRPSEPF